MPRFQYRFDTLLNLRGSQLEVEKAALGALHSERAGIQRSIDILQRSGEQALCDILKKSAVSGLEMAGMADHRKYVAARVSEARRRLQDCEARIGRQRDRVIQAERAWKLLDRLRERDLEEWSGETRRTEEATAGELYLASWNRKQPE